MTPPDRIDSSRALHNDLDNYGRRGPWRTQFAVPCRVERTRDWLTLPNEFAFRADRPAKWLQLLCLWVLRRLRAFRQIANDACHTVTIDKRRLDLVRVLIREAEERGYRPDSKWRVLMGNEDFIDLMHDDSFNRWTPVAMTFPPEALFGVPLTVVPWMKGVVLAPPEKF